MECSQVARELPEYLAGAASEPARRALESHLRRCASCQQRWEGVRRVWNLCGEVPELSPPSSMRERFHAALEVRQHSRDGREGLDWHEMPQREMRGWPPPRAAQLALSLAAIAAALALGVFLGGRSQPTERLETLEDEVRSLRQLVAVSMLEQRTASQRLRGVTYSSHLNQPEPEVLSTLVNTLKYDSSPNVRLAVVGVLRQFGSDPVVRGGLVESLERPQSPMVQLSLIDLLVEIGESDSVAVLQEMIDDEMVHADVRERAIWGLDQLG